MDNIDYKNIPEYDRHEMVVDLSDGDSGISGFIAIHNSHLGPALGGTRIFNYKNETQALKDVLRLSRAMTYKCAIAGLPFGGGKGVIIVDQPQGDLNRILKTYAQKVSSLGGKFYTGEDVGLTEPQVQYMLQFSNYFIGKTGLAGDPSEYAALSTFICIQVALDHVFKSPKIAGKRFAIKGVGKTGSELARLLDDSGGVVFATDIDPSKIEALKKTNPRVKQLTAAEMDLEKVDVFAPCALGDDIDEDKLKFFKTPIICGTSNNQLTNPEIAEKLFSIGILHVPDYIANAGGLINVADELLPGGYDKARVLANIDKLKWTAKKVLEQSDVTKTNPDLVADRLAESIFLK